MVRKKTKIVATIGPASISEKTLTAMVKAGMDVARLNLSHSDHRWHQSAIANIRKVEKKLRKRIGILADLQGPRIRVINEKPMQVKVGEKILFTDLVHQNKSKRKKKIILDWDLFFAYLKPNAKIFIEDGLIQFKVVSVLDNGCLAEVVEGGEVKPHKAVNIPSISSKMKTLTDKDIFDLKFALSQRVDMIALSFVANGQDIVTLRKTINNFLSADIIKKAGDYHPWIISKIERKAALKNLSKIIKYSDGVMVARGDLAIEVSQNKVGLLEKEIIKKSRRFHKPAIVATQMLASMENKRRPTRAEISDVTNAVIDQADALMLSGETATGLYPIHTVKTMSDIIKTVERSKYNDLRVVNRHLFKLLFSGKKSKYFSKTVNDLKILLKLSSLRQETVRLRLSKRKFSEWGKAALIWGVDTTF